MPEAEGSTFADGYKQGVRAERGRMILVLRTFADNAKKYSEEDGPEHLGYWEGRMDVARQVAFDLANLNG